jgi:proteic killer suppression protein
MQLFVRDNKLRAALEDEALCKKRYGADMAKKIILRIRALRAAECLGDFWPPMSGPERCHELKADLAGKFSVDLKQPYRLLFLPIEEPDRSYAEQRERWMAIKSIEVIRIEDTHG